MSQSGDYESLVNPKRRSYAVDEARAIGEEFPARAELPVDESPKENGEPEKPLEIGAVDQWSFRKGHKITFIALFFFSIVLYFRPYELVPSLSEFKQMAFFFGVLTLCIYFPSQIVAEGNLTARPREINLILLFLVTAFLSMPLATSPGAAYTEFTEVLLKAIVIFIVLVNVVRTEMRLKLLIWLVFAVSVYLSWYAINDYMNGVYRGGIQYSDSQRIAGVIGGIFGNSNDLAMHLATMFPIAIGFAFATKGLPKRILYVALAVLFVSAIVVTFSRAGFLGFFIAALVLARKIGRRNKFLSTAALVLALLTVMALAPGSYSGRLSTIFDSAADVTGSSSQRTEILKRSIFVTLRYPLFGVGIGNFHFKSVQELVTHNAYTQVSSEMGIPALVIYVMLMVYPLRRLREIERETQGRPDKRKFYYWSIGIQASIIAYMVGSFFGSVAYQWYIYYLVGYAVALRRLYYLDQHAERQT